MRLLKRFLFLVVGLFISFFIALIPEAAMYGIYQFVAPATQASALVLFLTLFVCMGIFCVLFAFLGFLCLVSTIKNTFSYLPARGMVE